MSADQDRVELRGMVDRDWIDIIDAMVHASVVPTSRIEIVNAVMKKFAKEKFHEATVICRVGKGNGVMTEA